MFIDVEFDSDIPIYLQIRNEIVRSIAIGNLKNGDSLPSVRQMSSMIEVNLHTINKAYNLLKDEGFVKIDRRTGAMIDVCEREAYKEEFEEKLKLILSEAFLMGISKDEIVEKVLDNFKNFKRER
ncbi:MAG: GntR family transcriptional regulator [Clostridium sp.]|uniref:GntR family transcriptional regulator n=1 Tax=Clostridium sp. TaxID=1506 RepID=UPI003F322A87